MPEEKKESPLKILYTKEKNLSIDFTSEATKDVLDYIRYLEIINAQLTVEMFALTDSIINIQKIADEIIVIIAETPGNHFLLNRIVEKIKEIKERLKL